MRHMGGCQNYGPRLGSLNTIYTKDPKKDHNFDNHPHVQKKTGCWLLAFGLPLGLEVYKKKVLRGLKYIHIHICIYRLAIGSARVLLQ